MTAKSSTGKTSDEPAFEPAVREIDITAERCPMTFVRTRLALDRMEAGQTLRVRLRGEEPLANVPRMAESLGHSVLQIREEADGVTAILLRKAPAPPAG